MPMDGTITMGSPDSNVDEAASGVYSVTYTCTDSAGNSDEAARIVVVFPQTTTIPTEPAVPGMPVITLAGDNPATITAGDQYSEAGASCSDADGRDHHHGFPGFKRGRGGPRGVLGDIHLHGL